VRRRCGLLSNYFDHLLWPPYVIGQSIIFSSSGFCFFSLLSCFIFPRLISAVAHWRSTVPYFHTWSRCGLSANLERRSDMCCTWLAENTGRKKSLKIRHLGTIAQLCWAVSSQLRHISTIGKKLLSSNISSRCPHNMVNFGLLAAAIGPVVWGTPSYAFASWRRYCTTL